MEPDTLSKEQAQRLYELLLKEGYSEKEAHEMLDYVAFDIKPTDA